MSSETVGFFMVKLELVSVTVAGSETRDRKKLLLVLLLNGLFGGSRLVLLVGTFAFFQYLLSILIRERVCLRVYILIDGNTNT